MVARAVVLATGARYRKLAVPGIESFEGNGVYYAATFQEALMCGTGPSSSSGVVTPRARLRSSSPRGFPRCTW